MDPKTIIHISIEIVVLVCLMYWMKSRVSTLKQTIESLQNKVQEHDKLLSRIISEMGYYHDRAPITIPFGLSTQKDIIVPMKPDNDIIKFLDNDEETEANTVHSEIDTETKTDADLDREISKEIAELSNDLNTQD